MSIIHFPPTPSLPIVKYQTNSSDINRNKKKNGNPILRHFSVEFQTATFDNEIRFRQKKTFDTPI